MALPKHYLMHNMTHTHIPYTWYTISILSITDLGLQQLPHNEEMYMH